MIGSEGVVVGRRGSWGVPGLRGARSVWRREWGSARCEKIREKKTYICLLSSRFSRAGIEFLEHPLKQGLMRKYAKQLAQLLVDAPAAHATPVL